MTTEARLERLEEVSSILAELMPTVVGMVQRQEDLIGAQQELLGQHQEMLARQQEQLGDHREMLNEVREDVKMTRRLWVRLATKHGWLDDEDLNGDSV